MLKALKILSLIALVWTMVVASYGAYVRLNDAGLDCPSWPECYDSYLVPDTAEEKAKAAEKHGRIVDEDGAWKEMNHRFIAAALGLLILILLYLNVRLWWHGHRLPLGLPIIIVACVILQGLLGKYTVDYGVYPPVVTAHLIGGMTLMALLTWYNLRVWLYKDELPESVQNEVATAAASKASARKRHQGKTVVTAEVSGFIKLTAVAALVLLSLQIVLGGWTSTNYTAQYCNDFPGCRTGNFWPSSNFTEAFYIQKPSLPASGDWEGGALPADARETIHMTHRAMAAVVVIVMVGLLIVIRVSDSTTRRHRAISLLVFALLLLQITIGVATAISKNEDMFVNLAALHNTGAALLLCSLVWLNFSLRRP